MNYSQIKKLDEETLEKLTEGSGPSDKCLCSLLYSPDEEGKKGFRASIKKAFGSLGGRGGKKQKKNVVYGQNSIDVPITYTKGGNGIYTTSEPIQRTSACSGKCGCDDGKLSLKHSYANIRITAPDIDMSSICSCPSNCMPQLKEKLQSSIKVTVEHLTVADEDAASQDTGYAASQDTEYTEESGYAEGTGYGEGAADTEGTADGPVRDGSVAERGEDKRED